LPGSGYKLNGWSYTFFKDRIKTFKHHNHTIGHPSLYIKGRRKSLLFVHGNFVPPPRVLIMLVFGVKINKNKDSWFY